MASDPVYARAMMMERLADRLKVALWVYDFDEKRIAWANQTALNAWQAETLDALRDRDLGTDMSRSVEQRLNQYRDGFIAHDATFSELWTLYPNGVPTTMQVIFRSFHLEDGRMAMLCEGTNAQEITSEALRSADALLHTSAMISLFHANGEQLYRNPAAHTAYGSAPLTLKHQFTDSEDLHEMERDLERSGVARLTARMDTAKGVRWHEITMRHCKDAVTGEGSILVSEIDISDMKAMKQRLQDLADVSSDWFWEMDSEFRFTYLSESVTKLAGIDIDATLGKKRSYLIASKGAAWQKHLDDLKNHRPFRNFEYTINGCDEKVYHVSISGVPVFDQQGTFSGYRGTGSNINERIEAERQLAQQHQLESELAKEREINGLQRQFVSMVSHEFRTPLAIIDGNAQRLIRRLNTLTPERAGDVLYKIRRSVSRLTELMESVLNAARLEEGRIVCSPEPCDLTAIISEICESYAEVYPDHAIEMDIDGLPAQIVADPKLVRQVISNLASNAVKYSPGGTTVRVKGSEDSDNGDVVVAVQDEGVGIPQAEVDQLCNRFFRASTSTGITGTGIGLHLVQHFLAMHGGRMDVDSVEGQGSTFTARLPNRAA